MGCLCSPASGRNLSGRNLSTRTSSAQKGQGWIRPSKVLSRAGDCGDSSRRGALGAQVSCRMRSRCATSTDSSGLSCKNNCTPEIRRSALHNGR